MNIFDACLDVTCLIGRDPVALAADYGDAVSEEPDDVELTLMEHRAMEGLLQSRADRLAPTAARAIAIGLVPAAAMLCESLDEVDNLLEATCEWIEEMEDPARYARSVAALREMGEDVPEARMMICMASSAIVLDVYDETKIIALLMQPSVESTVIGIVEFDDDGDAEDTTRLPTLAA